MAKILLISHNSDFLQDLQQQLQHHPDWEVRTDFSDDVVFEAAVVDDDVNEVQKLSQSLVQTPMFLLWSGESELPENEDLHVVRKPFRLQKLTDALHTAINAARVSGKELPLNGCVLDLQTKEVHYGEPYPSVKLTEREAAILKYLYKSGDKIVSKSELLTEVWGYNPEATTHTVETHIYRLRQKIEQDKQIIVTEENGYKLKSAE